MATKVQTKSWVEKTPGICGGDPCIRNTRITVHGLVEWRKLGLNDQEIMETIDGLSQDDLEAAWDYYARNREEIEGIIKEEREA